MFESNPNYTTEESWIIILIPVFIAVLISLFSLPELGDLPDKNTISRLKDQVEECYSQKKVLTGCSGGSNKIHSDWTPIFASEGFAVVGDIRSITTSNGIIEVKFIRGRNGYDGENFLVLPYVNEKNRIIWETAGSCQEKQCDLKLN